MCHLINGDNLHETSNPVFRRNKKNIFNLSSAELAQRVVKVKVHFVCVEALCPSQPIRVMLSTVSLPNHRFSPLNS